MEDNGEVEVTIIKIIYLDGIPIPGLFFKYKASKEMEDIARKTMQERKLLAVSLRPVRVGQIICGLIVDKIANNIVYLRGAHRLEIKKIVVDNEETLIVKAEIKDYIPGTFTNPTFSSKERLIQTIKPIVKLCQELNKYFPMFPLKDFNYFNSLDAFVDQIMVSLVSSLATREMKLFGTIFLNYSRQEYFLDQLNADKRAIYIREILEEILDSVRKLEITSTGKVGTSEPKPHKPKAKKTSEETKEEDERPHQKWLKAIKKAKVPAEAMKEAGDALKRIVAGNPGSSEYAVAEIYLDWICSLPWQKRTKDNLDIKHAEKILNQDHFGLEKAKERIIEHLAVRKLNPNIKGQIICFIGPPGTGKTSLGRSIARAMGRKFCRLSLGGVHDEAEIRGHRRTYVGALPGEIISNLKKVGVNNPIFMLDEIDKTGNNKVRGDLESALLEVLDPEQNNSFRDHYINAPFDLSKVFFITTGNIEDMISPILRDRMEIIHFDSYTLQEKREIAKRHILAKQVKQNGLNAKQISMTVGALEYIIQYYTREAGVRNLEREIAKTCRKVAVKIAKSEGASYKITAKNLHEFLGVPKYSRGKIKEVLSPGVAIGLVWTSVGGDVILIETVKLPRKNGSATLKTTGLLGDVIRESIDIALTVVEKHAGDLGIDIAKFRKHKVHIHIPKGAVPKDGPSAGITIVTALASLFTGKKVKESLAMTGEVTLSGDVCPVGGLKEKILAGYREGIKEFIIPAENEKDISEIPEDIKGGLVIHCVEKIEEVFNIALDIKGHKSDTDSHRL